MRPRTLMLLVLMLCLPAGPAHAQGIFTPYLGFTHSDQTDQQRVNFGAALGSWGSSVAGFEVDVGYAPDFFDSDESELTVMGNLLVGRPNGTIRPYVAGGLGLLHSTLEGEGINDFGMNVGGGVLGFLDAASRIGLRGDIRYFRELSDTPAGVGPLEFWRGTVGMTFVF